MSELSELSAVEQRRLIATGDTSATELLESHLANVDARNGDLNAIVSADPELARNRARTLDTNLAAGHDAGPLAGLVTAHKDLADTADFPTTYGSPVFAEHHPAADELIVARMKAAGAIAIGKTNTPEFGAGSHTFNPVFGTTQNPYDATRTAGGSSGGAAVALAANMVSIADGSDMGGSLRNPAAWNNVIGLRPSPGRVPRTGPDMPWSNLATSGPMARTVDDLALLFGVIAGFDVRDPLSRGLDVTTPVPPVDRPLRVAWSDDLGGLPVEPDVRGVLAEFRTRVDALGWNVVDDEPNYDGADECFLTLRAWYYAHGTAGRLPATELARLKQPVQLEVREGRQLSGDDVAGALAHLKVLWNRSVAFFDTYDLLIAPVTQVSPFTADQDYPTVVDGVESERYTDWMRSCCRITTMGLPALSLPAGFTNVGLPVGAQLVGPPWGDIDLLRAAKSLESTTP